MQTQIDATPSLRLFVPPESQGMTVRRYYETVVKPDLDTEKRAPETLAEHERGIRRWELFCGAKMLQDSPSEHRTTCPVLTAGGPALDQISSKMIADFRNWLAVTPVPDMKGHNRITGKRSVNKYVGVVSMIVNRGAETGDTVSTVKVRRLKETPADNKVELSDEQIDRLMDACEVATWPPVSAKQQTQPVIIWRFAIVWFVNYGIRTEDLMAYSSEESVKPIGWDNIYDMQESPHHNGKETNEHGWLVFVPTKTQHIKPQPLIFPINEVARGWLGKLQCAEDDRSGLPLINLPNCGREFYKQWDAIVAAAKVGLKPVIEQDANGNIKQTRRKLWIKHLRSTAGTRADNHIKGLGKLLTGHAASRNPDEKVFMKHYYNQEELLVKGLNSLPQPESFRRLL